MERVHVRGQLFTACVCALFFLTGCGSNESNGTELEMQQEEVQQETAQEENREQEVQAHRLEENAEEAVQEELTLSVLGDSISTFDDWIPEGYYDFYPMYGEVPDVSQTWWKMVLDDMGMELCANGSSAGSTCIGDSVSMENPQCGCSDLRIGDLIGANGRYPDIIIVYMGINDHLQSIFLGENDGTQYVEEGNIENFSDAYCLMLDKLEASYPNARIFCCNLQPVGVWGEERMFDNFVNGLGLTSEDYSRQIETIATTKGFPVIDLQGCGITVDNMPQYVTDGVHLNVDGMKLVRDAVEAALASAK